MKRLLMTLAVCAALVPMGALAQGVSRTPVDRGFSLLVGGGAEDYTGDLADEIDAGLSWGAMAGFRATPMLGVELAYNGGIHELGLAPGGSATDGADLVRNGGHAAALLMAPLQVVEPYVTAGIGLSRYTVRGGDLGLAQALGYDDDTVGNVPLGVGLRRQFGELITLDGRFTYNVLFDQDLAPTRIEGQGGRYQALLSLGGTY